MLRGNCVNLYKGFYTEQDFVSSRKNIKQSTILNRLLTLKKGFLIVGGMVSENSYIDKEFETIHYCVMMLTKKIVRRN